MKYISFAKYIELGGKNTDESTFLSLQVKLESKLNYITFGRLEKLYEADNLPKEIEALEVELIDALSSNEVASVEAGVSSYDNGIEKITYISSDKSSDNLINTKIFNTAQAYLFKYPELFYRGRINKAWTQK